MSESITTTVWVGEKECVVTASAVQPACPDCGQEMAIYMIERPSGYICLKCHPPAKPGIDWRARCLAAEAERDRAQADAAALAGALDQLLADDLWATLDPPGQPCDCDACVCARAALAAHRARVGEARTEGEARDIPVDIFEHTTPQLGAATAELLRIRRDNEERAAAAPPPVEEGQVRRSPDEVEHRVLKIEPPIPEVEDEPTVMVRPMDGGNCWRPLSVVALWPLVAPPAEPREE